MRLNRNWPVYAAAILLPVLALGAAAGDPNAPVDESAFTGKIKVACIGDSITLGVKTTPAPKKATDPNAANAYPAQLRRMLGEKYEVRSFPASGRTLLSKGDKPFSKEPQYKDAVDYKPDVVFIMLGTNDTKTTPNNWSHKDEFVTDYKAFVEKFMAGDAKPRVFLLTPPWVRNDGLGTINEPDVVEEIPMINTVAKDLNVGVIDIHAATKGHDELYDATENVHPGNNGATVMAKAAFHAIKGKDYDGPAPVMGAAPRPTGARPAGAATQP